MASRFAPSNRRIRRLASFAVTIGVWLGLMLASSSPEAAGRHASMAVDANTGQVLHAQGADEPRYPASLTKMMTLYIVFDLMEQGRLQSSTRIRISDEAAGTQPSKLGLAPDSDIALGDAVRALITKSANDIAVAVAEHIAGTEAKFAALMTRRAHQLGMTATTFRNAHGLPDSGQVTTARDMLTLAMRLSDDFPVHYRLFSLRSFSYQGKTYANHNTMMGSYAGMDGLKTGYTTGSGFNLVASVRRGGKHVVAVVFGGNTASARNAHMRAILDRALPKAATEKTRTPVGIARAGRPDRQAAEPQQVAFRTNSEEPPPALLEKPRPVDRPRAVAEMRPEPMPRQSAGSRIEVARVRPVVVAPRVRPASPTVRAASQSEVVQPVTQHAALPGPAATEPVARGAAPSSLQAQAQRLERGAAPTTIATTSPAGMPAGTVAIQVGAYATEAEAQRQLAVARERSAAALSRASPSTQAVQAGGRQLYRARFVGLDAATAANACTELRRAQIDCLVAPIR